MAAPGTCGLLRSSKFCCGVAGVAGVFFFLYTQQYASTAAPTSTRKVTKPTAMPTMAPVPIPPPPESPLCLSVAWADAAVPVALLVAAPELAVTSETPVADEDAEFPPEKSFMTVGTPMSKTRLGLLQQLDPSE